MIKVFRGDELVSTGGESTLTTPWWRAGRYAELLIETKDEPLELVGLELEDSHYPVNMEGSFSTPDDPSLDAVWKICRRGMEMCAHEMVMDCPFYEQMMYGGDARIQGLILSALGSDDALMRRVIDFYAFKQRDDGLVPMVYPARHDKVSATYSLTWALMFGDYAMWHDDTAWLKARLPSLHHLLSGLAAYENADGLLENLPGWNFIDWVAEPEPWYRGDAPDGRLGKAENALNNLFYVLALQSGAKANRVVGDEAMAAVWDGRAKRVAETLVAKYWDERKGALSDTLDHAHFSEHAQCLALLAGALPEDKAARAFETLVTAKDLSRTTVYFSHYLFETYLLYGRTDLILKRLDLWRDFVRVGLKTPLESPSPTLNARSDCHAWGSHPIYHLITGVAGIRPGSEGFKTVRIAPAPGPLTRFTATCPHPKGRISVDLTFENGACRGKVTTPVPGTFVWNGRTLALKVGENPVALPRDNSKTIVCYGDSLTAGQSSVVTQPSLDNYQNGYLNGKSVLAGYPYFLAKSLKGDGFSVVNISRGGMKTANILSLQGAKTFKTVKAFTLPADTSLIDFNNGVTDNYGPSQSNMAVDGAVATPPQLSPDEVLTTDGNGTYGSMCGVLKMTGGDIRVRWRVDRDNGEYFNIRRMTAGNSSVTVPAGTVFVPDCAGTYQDAIQVIFAGQNDGAAGSASSIVPQIQAAVNTIGGGKRFVVVSYHTATDANYDAMKKTFDDAFGNNHLYLYGELKSRGLALAAQLGETATAATWNTKTTGLLSSDGLHFNRAGYHVLSYLVQEKLQALGYLQYRIVVQAHP